MRKKKLFSMPITILLVLAAVVLLVKHFHIPDFHVIKPGILYTSGQPRRMDYTRLLYRYHIATIVNVRLVSEHREKNWYNEEIIWVKTNAVNYVELPIARDNRIPDKHTQDEFLTLMADNDNLPVLLHGSGDDERVALLTAVWLVKTQRYTPEQAAEVARTIIDDKELTQAETEFINNLTR